MLKGIHLTLMMGPVIPQPVPKIVLDALTSIKVITNDDVDSVFQLSFEVGQKNSPLSTMLLMGGSFIPSPSSIPPIIRVIITITLNGASTVIMDGFITNHELKAQDGGNKFLLTITGSDLTALMGKIDFSGFPYPAVPGEGRVALMLAKYLALGVTPMIIPSVMLDVPVPTTRIPIQNGTDLTYIRYLAEKVGYVFYIEPGSSPGRSVAYWGPQVKVGVPQSPLNLDMDAHTNVESLSFNFDNSKNEIPAYYYYDELTKAVVPIPIPPITPLNPPLGLAPPIPSGFKPVGDDLSKYSVPVGLMTGLAKAARLAEAVTGTGELDVLRYGHILKARRLVGVRGAGLAYDGLYYVKSVSHNIQRGQYKQSFSLSRNGLISTIQRIHL